MYLSMSGKCLHMGLQFIRGWRTSKTEFKYVGQIRKRQTVAAQLVHEHHYSAFKFSWHVGSKALRVVAALLTTLHNFSH